MDNFETRVTNIDDYYAPEGIEEVYGTITVFWSYEMEMRDWGLKGAYIIVTKIEGSIFYQYEDDREETEVDINSLGFEIETEGLDELKLRNDVQPNNIEINYKDKTITIIF